MSFDYIDKLILIQNALNYHGQNMSYVESKRAQFEAMADDLADIIDAIKQERDALAAQVEKLRQINFGQTAQLRRLRNIFRNDSHDFATTSKLMRQVSMVVDESSDQALAARDADAINLAADALYKAGVTDALVSDWLVDYANQLRQAAKGGE